jgi:hypothetical protein
VFLCLNFFSIVFLSIVLLNIFAFELYLFNLNIFSFENLTKAGSTSNFLILSKSASNKYDSLYELLFLYIFLDLFFIFKSFPSSFSLSKIVLYFNNSLNDLFLSFFPINICLFFILTFLITLSNFAEKFL